MNISKKFSGEGKSVLITGCSSGIGWATAVHLAGHGLTVFATVRKEADAERLRGLNEPNLVPIFPLDLTRLDQVPPVMDIVRAALERRHLPGLFALIHNAGGGMVSPVEMMDLLGFRRELETRILGSVALTQAFLPLIRPANGRILWIMTPGLIPTPYVASIHACDFAVNCLARTLEIELKLWRIPSIMIRCGGIKTETGLRTTADVEAALASAPPGKAALYEEAFRRWADSMTAIDRKRTAPEKVAEVVLEALSAAKPKRRYSIGTMARAAAILESMPQALADRILKARF